MSVQKIASLTGVSAATVSYALNGREGVSEETRSKVLEAAKSIGYEPAVRKARQTVTQKGTCLGFISCTPFPVWGEHYFGQMLKGCVTKSQEKEVLLSVSEIDPDSSPEAGIPKAARSDLVKGLIITGWPSRELMDLLARQSKPIVLLDTRDVYEGFNHVRPDHAGGTIKSVEYLYQLGHRKIGVITGDMRFACEVERLMAYTMAMTKLGLSWDERWIIKQPVQGGISGYKGMKSLLEQKIDVTAVLCHGDLIAKEAIRVAREAGLSVPGDISIMGFDNQPFSAEVDPPMTTVDVSLQALGQAAVGRLLELIADPDAGIQRITIESKLVERKSTARIER